MKQIPYSILLDKTLACWTGKSLGGIVGAPYECHKQFKPVSIDKLWPKILYPNDDLDIQVVYLECLQQHGLFIDSKTLATYWKQHCFYACCEYGIFLNNYDHAIYPPYSGILNNDWFKTSMGCPIRSEIWGILCAGNPKLATTYAAMDGCLDHDAFSVEIECYLAAAASLAFFDDNVTTVLEKALELLPPQSEIRSIYFDVKDICRNAQDEHSAWLQVIRHQGHRNATESRTNFALTLMALFIGKDDFKKVMQICMESGWDADCTAATAGALLGLVHGTKILPQDWCDKMGKSLVCACEIPHQNASLASFAEETCLLTVEMSQLLNHDLCIAGAPQVLVRPKPFKPLSISVAYPQDAVLYTQKESKVKLTVTNNQDKPVSGTLQVEKPAHTEISANNVDLDLAAGGSQEIELAVRVKDVDYLPEKNFFKARFTCSCGAVLEEDFGLYGASQYQVYGPYWDMWDKTKYPVCPYDCEELTCNPGNIPGLRDAMDMYVEIDREYLDENKLKTQPIPEEQPMEFEKCGPFLYNSDWDNFFGTCCYYLCTTIRSSKELEHISLGIGSNVPTIAWLDGKEIFRQEHHLCRQGCPTLAQDMKLDETPHRLVIKLIARTEHIQLTWQMGKPVDSRKEGLSPYVNDLEYKISSRK